jgi:NADPH:quinone reductase-like Zn-dependent oxidoreductase
MKLRYKILGFAGALIAIAVVASVVILSHDSACPAAVSAVRNGEVMKAIVFRCYGAPDVLSYEDVPKPVPSDNEVLVRVRAAAINPLEWHFMRGTPYLIRLRSGMGAPKDHRFGVDFAGTVEAVGKNVRRFKIGDDVFGGGWGSLAQYMTITEDDSLVAKPSEVTFEQAASAGIAGVTALQGLRDKGHIQRGQKVLINGASGGVGTFAVQIAKSFGAEVTGVTSTKNLEMVKSIGADHVIDYTREDFTRGAQRYDLIFDTVVNRPLLDYRRALEPEGTFAIIGGPSDDPWIGPMINPIKALFLSPFIHQHFVLLLADMTQQDLTVLGELMKGGKVKPVIDKRFPLSETSAAMRYLEQGHARGKIIITMD